MDQRLDVIAMGRIANVGGVPGWAWQQGFNAAIVDNGVGDYTVALQGGGADALECAIFVNPDEAATATNLTTCGCVHVSDTDKRITIVQEDNAAGGDPTIAYDGPVNILVVKHHAETHNMELIACGFLNFGVAGVPSWAGGTSYKGFALAIADNGIGDWSVTLDGGGADATECVVSVCSAENLGASNQTSYGVVHTSDTVKQITCVQEQAAGGASIRYDGPCIISVWRRSCNGARDLDVGMKVIAAGRFNADGAGNHAWLWQEGFTALIVRNAAGDYSLQLDRPAAQGDCMVLVSACETMAAQRSTSYGVSHTTDLVKRVTTMQETGAGGGAASAAADKDFDIVVFKRTAG